MMKMCVRVVLAAALVLAFASFSSNTKAWDDGLAISARLRGLNETPPTNSLATGTLRAKISSDKTSITFTITWNGLTGPPAVSHIHFGPSKEAGGVMVFFCGGGGKPACSQSTSGSASGTITGADIVGPTAQGIEPAPVGQFSDVIRAILTGNGYANIHTAKFPGRRLQWQSPVHLAIHHGRSCPIRAA